MDSIRISTYAVIRRSLSRYRTVFNIEQLYSMICAFTSITQSYGTTKLNNKSVLDSTKFSIKTQLKDIKLLLSTDIITDSMPYPIFVIPYIKQPLGDRFVVELDSCDPLAETPLSAFAALLIGRLSRHGTNKIRTPIHKERIQHDTQKNVI